MLTQNFEQSLLLTFMPSMQSLKSSFILMVGL